MSILPRYFLRLFLPSFLLCLAVFCAVLLMSHFLKIFNMAVMKGISPLWVAECFARLLPFVMSLALPMAFLVALLLTLSGLSESGEVMALRGAGFSFIQMTWPFLATGTLLSGALLYLNHKASPEGFHSFRNRFARAAQQIARVEVEAGAFVRLGQWKFFAQEADKASGLLRGVYLVRQEAGARSLRINARRGRLGLEEGAAVLELAEGDFQIPNPEPEKLTAGRFRTYRVSVPLSGGAGPRRAPDMQEMSTSRLEALIAAPETSAQHRAEYAVEATLRSAAALSPFVFFWIAAPLGLLGGRGRGGSFALSLGILFAFYGLIALGISVGRRHPALSRIAPWAADAAGLALGAALTRRAARL